MIIEPIYFPVSVFGESLTERVAINSVSDAPHYVCVERIIPEGLTFRDAEGGDVL